jgi:hypothetical protein
MASVIHRYQESHRRTWCSSSPVSPLPAWKFSSIRHLADAVAISRVSGTGPGAQRDRTGAVAAAERQLAGAAVAADQQVAVTRPAGVDGQPGQS